MSKNECNGNIYNPITKISKISISEMRDLLDNLDKKQDTKLNANKYSYNK